MKQKANQITVYWPGSFFGSINKTEGTLIEHGTKEYAQYKNAPFVTMVPAKKRKPVVIRKDYKPFILVLAGTGHPEPQDMFVAGESNGLGVTSRISKYSSFDDRWETDFDQMIDKYIEEKKPVIVADYRHTKGFRS